MGASDLERGARFELRLEAIPSDPTRARYHGAVTLPGLPSTTARRVLACAEESKVESGDGELPAWAEKWLLTLARQAQKTWASTGQWPRRIRQWKDETTSTPDPVTI